MSESMEGGRRAPLLLRLWLVLAAALLVGVSIWSMQVGHLDGDEGYNLSVVTTLLEDGRYGTKRLSGIRDFNADITTGPVVMLPIAAAAKLLGPTKLAVRLVPLLFFWALAAMTTALAWRRYGLMAGCLSLTLLSVSSYVAGISVRVLGEAAGLFFVLVAFWAVERGLDDDRPGWWALVFAASLAAVLCKFQYLLVGLPALALTGGLLVRRHPRALWPLVAMGAGLVGGVGLWLGVQCLAIGWEETLLRLSEMRKFSNTVQPGGAGSNVPLIGTMMPVPVFLAVAAWSLWHLKRAWREALPMQLVVLGLGWFGWFLFLDKQTFARHAYPAVVVFFVLFAAAVAQAWTASARLERPRWRLATRGAIALVVVLMVGSRAVHSFRPSQGPEGRRGADETIMAAYIRAHVPANGVLFGYSFVLPWSMGFLTGRPVESFPPYALLALTPAPYLLVSMGEDYWFRRFLEARTQPVFSTGAYHLYRLQPGALVAPNSLDQPAALGGAVRLAGPSPAGERPAVLIELDNTGAAAWLGPTADGRGQVRLMARWDGHPAAPAWELDADVPPGGHVARALAAPSPGRHELELTLESQGLRTFGRPFHGHVEVK